MSKEPMYLNSFTLSGSSNITRGTQSAVLESAEGTDQFETNDLFGDCSYVLN